MLFLPKGPQNGDVVDPDKLARDFIEADRVASQTTQWQWSEKCVQDPTMLEYGSHVDVLSAITPADLSIHRDSPSFDLSDSDLFMLSYNNGYKEITDMKLEWDSVYPELVKFVFSFQYARKDITNDPTTSTNKVRLKLGYDKIRASIRLKVDGVLQEGAGCYMKPPDGSPRGMGYSWKSMASCITVITMLPAGTHTVVPVAQLHDCTAITSLDHEGKRISAELAPTSAAAIAGRQMIAIRFARGKWLGA